MLHSLHRPTKSRVGRSVDLKAKQTSVHDHDDTDGIIFYNDIIKRHDV